MKLETMGFEPDPVGFIIDHFTVLFQPFCKGTTSSNRFQQEPITSKKTRKFGLFWINRGKLGVMKK